jgi:hypothetical protein
MPVSFEYKNMSFEKVDGVWLHKDWALPGDFGDVFDKPASSDLSEKVELAYQVHTLEKRLLEKENSKAQKKDAKPASKSVKVAKDVELDFTKTLEDNGVTPLAKVKKTNLKGFFNPFKDGIKL